MEIFESNKYKNKLQDYLYLNYSMVFKNKELFSSENMKAYNTLKSFEKSIKFSNDEMKISYESAAHFKELTGSQSNVISLESLARNTISQLENLNISSITKENFKKDLKKFLNHKYTEKEIYPIMDRYISQIAPSITNKTYKKKCNKSDYIIAKTAFYLIIASPFLLALGYKFF